MNMVHCLWNFSILSFFFKIGTHYCKDGFLKIKACKEAYISCWAPFPLTGEGCCSCSVSSWLVTSSAHRQFTSSCRCRDALSEKETISLLKIWISGNQVDIYPNQATTIVIRWDWNSVLPVYYYQRSVLNSCRDFWLPDIISVWQPSKTMTQLWWWIEQIYTTHLQWGHCDLCSVNHLCKNQIRASKNWHLLGINSITLSTKSRLYEMTSCDSHIQLSIKIAIILSTGSVNRAGGYNN